MDNDRTSSTGGLDIHLPDEAIRNNPRALQALEQFTQTLEPAFRSQVTDQVRNWQESGGRGQTMTAGR